MLAWKQYGFSILFSVIFLILEAIIMYSITALENVGEQSVRSKAEKGQKDAMKIVALLEKQQYCPNFLLLLTNTINLAIGFLYSKRIFFWSDYFSHWSVTPFEGTMRKIFQVIGMLILVFIVTFFSNALPRKLALKDSERKVLKYACFLKFFFSIVTVFSVAIDISLKGLLFIMQKKEEDYQENVTEDEIISIVNEGLEQGVLENTEVEMISNIIEMDEKEVKDIMTRRKQIVAIDGASSVADAIQKMMEKNYSRYPVYEGDIDNIIGVVFWKDVTKYYIEQKDRSRQIQEIAKKAYLVPDTKKINVLFEEMQMKKVQMAVAIDEYGQTVGIVAMEDVLEEIVGKIYDEFDESERYVIQQRPGRYFMKGMLELEEMSRILHIDMEKELEDYDTLNGFLVSKIGHIPTEKEKVTIYYQGYEFRVVDIKNKMIRLVRVHKLDTDEAEK